MSIHIGRGSRPVPVTTGRPRDVKRSPIERVRTLPSGARIETTERTDLVAIVYVRVNDANMVSWRNDRERLAVHAEKIETYRFPRETRRKPGAVVTAYRVFGTADALTEICDWAPYLAWLPKYNVIGWHRDCPTSGPRLQQPNPHGKLPPSNRARFARSLQARSAVTHSETDKRNETVAVPLAPSQHGQQPAPHALSWQAAMDSWLAAMMPCENGAGI